MPMYRHTVKYIPLGSHDKNNSILHCLLICGMSLVRKVQWTTLSYTVRKKVYLPIPGIWYPAGKWAPMNTFAVCTRSFPCTFAKCTVCTVKKWCEQWWKQGCRPWGCSHTQQICLQKYLQLSHSSSEACRNPCSCYQTTSIKWMELIFRCWNLRNLLLVNLP